MIIASQTSTSLILHLSVSLLTVLIAFGLWIPQDASAMRVALLPFKARHLNQSQKNAQLKLFSKELSKLRGVRVVGAESILRVMKNRRQSPKVLEQINKNKDLVLDLCERLQVDLLLFPEMKLGTNTQPAKLISRLIGCRQATQMMHSVSFSGRLSRALWSDIAQQIDPKLMTLLNQEQEQSRHEARSSASFTPTQLQPIPNPQLISPPPPLNQPLHPAPFQEGVNQSSAEVNTSQKTILKPMVSPDARDPWAARLTLWAEGRAMNRTFDLTTREQSISLKGGISYTSRWIMGYGFSGRVVFNRIMAVEGDFAEFQFNSTQVIYNLFDDNDFLLLKSFQRNASAGFTISNTFSTSSRQHRAGVRLGWYMNQHKIEPNNEYQGFTAHGADLHVFGILALTENSSWLELRGKLVPLVTLGESVVEIGERAESLGFGFTLNLINRWSTGLGIKLGVSFDELVHTPNGPGRGGRVGLSATDQLFQAVLSLGWLGPK